MKFPGLLPQAGLAARSEMAFERMLSRLVVPPFSFCNIWAECSAGGSDGIRDEVNNRKGSA